MEVRRGSDELGEKLMIGDRHHGVHGYIWFVSILLPPLTLAYANRSIDNVVRAGLTPKLRDVPTLVSMLTYTSAPPSSQLLPPASYKSTSHTLLYDPPISEFSVLLTSLPPHAVEEFEGIEGPSILIFTEVKGEGIMRSEGKEYKIGREGMVFFVGAGAEVELEAAEGMIAYRAFVEVEESS
jgi:mannose-6-phosphate isomerase